LLNGCFRPGTDFKKKLFFAAKDAKGAKKNKINNCSLRAARNGRKHKIFFALFLRSLRPSRQNVFNLLKSAKTQKLT